jgi:hypothetical protein
MPTHSRDHTDCGAWRVSVAEKVRQRQAEQRLRAEHDREQELDSISRRVAARIGLPLNVCRAQVAAVAVSARKPADEDAEDEAAE